MRAASLPALCLAAQAIAGAAIDLEALAANSPFGTAPSTGSAASAAPAPNLELRGMYRENGRTFYSVYNTTTKQGLWVAEGDKPTDAAAPAVKSFDAATSTLVVEIGGKPASLTLKAATVSKYEAPPQVAARSDEGAPRGGPPLPEPGPDGKVQTPWGSFTPEQIAAYRAERERRWQERMQQMQAEGGEGSGRRSRPEEGSGEATPNAEGGRRRGSR